MVNVSMTNKDNFDMKEEGEKDYGVLWKMFYFKENKMDYKSKTLFISECQHVFYSWCIDQ